MSDAQAPPPFDPRGLIRRIEEIKERPLGSLDEHSRLGELGGSFAEIMYVVTTLQNEWAVTLPLDQIMRIHTVGELVELVRKAPRAPSLS